MSKRYRIHPTFSIPEGLEDFEYTTPDDGWENNEDNVSTLDRRNLDYEDPYPDDDGDDGPEAPTSVTVLSQASRIASDGTQTVDIVFDVEELAGIVKYDVRTSKT